MHLTWLLYLYQEEDDAKNQRFHVASLILASNQLKSGVTLRQQLHPDINKTHRSLTGATLNSRGTRCMNMSEFENSTLSESLSYVETVFALFLAELEAPISSSTIVSPTVRGVRELIYVSYVLVHIFVS